MCVCVCALLLTRTITGEVYEVLVVWVLVEAIVSSLSRGKMDRQTVNILMCHRTVLYLTDTFVGETLH